MAYTTIDDPSAHFQVKRYTGTNANQSLTNDGNSNLQPDLIFASYLYGTPPYTNHRAIIDSSRGRAKILESDTTAVEASTTNAAYDLVSFDTNGFTVGAVNSTSALNASGINHIAWQWKANGGTTSTNTDGAVTSTVQVNSDAGFSILTYTMNSGSNETVGHGLGVVPDIIIYKARQRGDSNGFWHVYTTLIDGSLDYLKLNEDVAKSNSSLSSPTSTTFVGGGSSTEAYRHFVAYCFKSIQGYSKFGTYIGNGGTGGKNNFVYTGFKPAFVMVKRTDSTSNWAIATNYNNVATNGYIWANNNNTQGNGAIFITATGFKITSTAGGYGASGGTYLYMAFAEYPIVTSTGVPTTAR